LFTIAITLFRLLAIADATDVEPEGVGIRGGTGTPWCVTDLFAENAELGDPPPNEAEETEKPVGEAGGACIEIRDHALSPAPVLPKPNPRRLDVPEFICWLLFVTRPSEWESPVPVDGVSPEADIDRGLPKNGPDMCTVCS